MGNRCKHGLIKGQCSICRKEAARAAALKAYQEANKVRTAKGMSSED